MPKADALFTTQCRCVLTGIMAAPLLAVTQSVTAAPLDDVPLFASHQRFRAAYFAACAMCRPPEPTCNTPEADAYEVRFNALLREDYDRLEELAAIPAKASA
ncbi:hypothetical protein LHT11_01690 [Acetobacter indonesiensis]|uniref:hypothetical protein n=1 Tax=Acetobacter indonesiensis TaxID=104101 RepID=UPI001F339831|nr:hypothetical protein [Acetobacter indonesiensis]MCG0993913.1 hypothetical protein [Acetobacter indonesiensis]